MKRTLLVPAALLAAAGATLLWANRQGTRLPDGVTASRIVDWTAGCIAMRNSDVDELWRAVPVGTPIEIRP